MRIGIYGGAFDPVHSQHLKIIERSYIELNLDKIILLPSYIPPHKESIFSPFKIRLEMLRADVGHLDYVFIDTREYNQSNRPNCAYEIIGQLKDKYCSDELIYIIGGDSMINFHTWVHPQVIAKLVPLAVVAREGYKGLDEAIYNAKNEYNATIMLLPFKGKNISSTLIKAKYEFKQSSDCISKEVHNIITSNNLYQTFDHHISKLQKSVTTKLFEHCKATVLYAMKFTNRLKQRYEEVFLSALLHDCAKEIMHIEEQFKKYPPKIVHQFVGAYIAQQDYGIKNFKILDAIRYHTTGKKEMSTLGKLIYCADMLEENRDFAGVQKLRSLLEKDFNEGFKACVRASISRVMGQQSEVYYLTKECYDYYHK